ncbi:MAG: glycosyltransferase family 4 protein [Gemmatimonadales bacterium]
MAEPRVIHLVPALFGARGVTGGAERYALELARAMAQRVSTTLVTFGPKASVESDGPLNIRVLGPARHVRGQATNPMAPGLFRALRHANVIHCHQQHVVASSAAAVFARLTRRTVVVSDLGGGGWDISGYVSTDRWYHAHLHLSAFSRKAFGHEGLGNAHVIYGGVDTVRFCPDPSVPREAFVLYVGRVLPHKGVDDLIEGLPHDLPLVVAGRVVDSRFRSDLDALARGKRVTFRDDLDDDALIAHYRRAMCIVLPSVHRTRYGQTTGIPELLGQTLLEGMACGTPAVATSVASLPEVVTDGVTGLLVPPNDPTALRAALTRLRDNPAWARALGESARRDVEARFVWDRVVQTCLEVYSRV